MRGVFCVFVLLCLSGCSSLSETECRAADWDQIGYRDGARGAAQSRSIDHSDACAEYGVTFDEQAYFAAYQRGLEEYCTPENAVKVGLSGGSYSGVCPTQIGLDFEGSYRAARVVYEQRQRVVELENRWRSLEYDLNGAENDEQRRYIRSQLYQLDRALREERDRLYYEEQRLREFTRGIL